MSATCLKYNAAASDVQNAINSLGFDFNGDGGYSIADYNHVQVSQSVTTSHSNSHSKPSQITEHPVNQLTTPINPQLSFPLFSQVSRSGDGSLASGYGYVYTLAFTGPGLTFGSSVVLGASEAAVEVMDEGHYGGCSDLNTTMAYNLLGLSNLPHSSQIILRHMPAPTRTNRL